MSASIRPEPSRPTTPAIERPGRPLARSLPCSQEPVACAALILHQTRRGNETHVDLRPPARGLGLGRRLLTRTRTARARGHGARTLQLETNRTLAEAIALYRSSGYREVEPFNDEPYAQHWFEKTLSGPPR